MRKALIPRGGWTGHQPVETADVFRGMLEQEGFSVTVTETLDCFLDPEQLRTFDLVVPVWTMSGISDAQAHGIQTAVASGVGLAGHHGVLGDASLSQVTWQFLIGGRWVAHPGDSDVTYRVHIRSAAASPIVDGMEDFSVTSEQYYVLSDPANSVLATTRFPVTDGPHAANGEVDIPVVWTRRWGQGRVFCNALGHEPAVWDIPQARELTRRGFLWAAREVRS